MTRFEINKTYVNKHVCGVYTYFEELTVTSISDSGNNLVGVWHSYVINENGYHFGDFTRNVNPSIRKVPNQDYQMTSGLLVRFYSNTAK